MYYLLPRVRLRGQLRLAPHEQNRTRQGLENSLDTTRKVWGCYYPHFLDAYARVRKYQFLIGPIRLRLGVALARLNHSLVVHEVTSSITPCTDNSECSSSKALADHVEEVAHHDGHASDNEILPTNRLSIAGRTLRVSLLGITQLSYHSYQQSIAVGYGIRE